MYELSATQVEFVETAADIAASVLAPEAAEVDRAAIFPAAGLAALADAGFYGLCLPEAVGGKGQPPRVYCAVVEELAAACGSTAMIYVMHNTAARAIAAAPPSPARSELLRQIARGEHLTTIAFSERGSRSQFWAPVSRFEEKDGAYVIHAFKSWITSAHHADSYVAAAQIPGAAGPFDAVLYLARRGALGVRAAGGFDGLGLRGNDSAPVIFDGLRIEADDLLSAFGEGTQMMLEVPFPWFNIGTSAMSVGLCRAATQATAAHLAGSGFEHTGEKLRDLPVLRARLGEMSCRTEQARALLAFTARSLEAPDDTTQRYVLLARLAALEAAIDVTDRAMQACGGAAFSRHLPLERLFRDARAGWVMAPTVDHLAEFTGRVLSGLPLF
ncbi:MAG TPA: acyl-CoA dehydrogenase family protein [Polyangiaceae bacterium]|nr:acyl-CoA dehydrogenase family protein [Polyangiaceae bacterium]